jgi:UTP-glucose-1-phosphate uridylyltransferase
MAAGIGGRALPYSKLLPKELSEVHGLPLVARVVTELAAAGVKNVVTVIGEDFDADGNNYQEVLLRRWFEPNDYLAQRLIELKKPDEESLLRKLDQGQGMNYEYVTQRNDGRYGTAMPLHAARHALRGSGRFLVVNGDDLMLSPEGASPLGRFVTDVDNSGAGHGVMVKSLARQESGVYPYGIMRTNESNLLTGYVEKPNAEVITELVPKANLGKYLFSESVFEPLGDYVGRSLEELQRPEYYLPDIFAMLNELGEHTYVHTTDVEFLDAGDANLRMIASMKVAGMPADIIAAAKTHLGLK